MSVGMAARAVPGAALPSPGRERPDVESATERYAQRFAGAAGSYLLGVQTRTLLGLLRRWPGATVLDVGGGHAQAAGPLVRAGYRVVVLGSDERAVQRPYRLLGAGRLTCVTGDLVSPPFDDRSFDVVVSLRIMPHVSDWRALLASLCRVARRAVLVDHPVPAGWNALTPLLFGLKRRVEGDTRRYTMIRRRDVAAQMRAAGFGHVESHAEFFWPMVLHRALRCPPVSRAIEAPARALGLTTLWGSPVLTLGVRE